MRHEPVQADDVRRLIREADEHLDQARRLLAGGRPDHRQLLEHSIVAIESTFRAFLGWHTGPVAEGPSLRTLGRRISSLESAFTTSAHLAPSLGELRAALANKDELTIDDREAVKRSYYVARNACEITHSALPSTLLPDTAPAG